MKIQIKISSDTILAVDRVFNKLSFANLNTQTEQVVLSLSLELSDIFNTRARQIIRESNLMNQNKIRSLTLKYHQAWALEKIIRSENTFPKNNPYQISLLNALADTINQKLI